ncbi:amidohydrolase family protein [Spirillospora sp. CA-294931]|uniref:amidohydrolase family protein n=1 Tax=Spirillospora sp. CA-294931 TaxID=3240042 RepID=UPI003D8F46F7
MILPVVSADSHVIEPPDLWTGELAQTYGDRVPRIFYDPDREGWYFACDGLQPALINSYYAVDRTPEQFAGERHVGLEAARPGGNRPGPRLADMDRDGVSAEVLFPSLAMSLFWLKDAAFQRDCFRVYNDWLADFAGHAPDRLVGCALISLWDAREAAAELARCRDLGLRGATVWASAPEEAAFSGTSNDFFWAAAQEMGVPVAMHCLTGYRDSPKVFEYDTPLERVQRNMCYPEELQHTLTDLIFSGVLERFPELRVVLAENDIGWIAYHLLHADRIHEKLGAVIPTPLTMRPSEYFRRQVSATFSEDDVGVLTTRILGSANFMWGSDYPHYEGTWPHSREVIDTALADLPGEDRRRLVHDNCAALYGLRDEDTA